MKTTFKTMSKVALILALLLLAVFVITSCGECEEHTWDNGTVQKASTCSEEGVMLYTCTECDETKTEPISKSAHNYVKNVIEPSCTTDGMTVYTCSVCSNSYNEDVVKAQHSYVITSTDATCTTPGEVRKECSKCGDTQIETVVSQHNYVKASSVATCTQDGLDTFTCSNCGDSYRVITERSHGHVTEGCEWTVTTEFANDGPCKYLHIETTQCKTCGEDVSITEEFFKHSYKTTITTNATCQTNGVKELVCSECDDSYEDEFTDVNAHNWDEGTVNGNLTTYTCTNNNCGQSKEVFSAKNETVATVPSDALQSAGEVELLGANVKLDKEVLDQLGATDVTISANTLSDKALEEVIKLLSEEDQAKLGSGKIYDFTLSQNDSLVSEFNGYITVTIRYDLEEGDDPENIAIWYINEEGKPDTFQAVYCEINGLGYAQFETQHFSYYTVIRMSPEERCAFYGHKYVASVIDASCNQEGYTIERCRTCSDIKRHTFTPALTHNYTKTVVNPTCTEKGYTLNTCSICDDIYISNQTAVIAHDYEQSVVAPTCTQKGYTLNKCKTCGNSYTQNEVSPLGHTYVNGVCSTCNKEATSADKSYLTLMNSLFSADTYLLSIDNLSVIVSQLNSTEITKVDISDLKAVIGFDEDGYAIGKGNGYVNVLFEGENIAVDAVVVFKNQKMYVYYSYKPTDANTTQAFMEYVGSAKQDFFIEEMMGPGGTVGMLSQMLSEYAYIWEDIVNTDNNPLDKVIEKIIGYMFVKTEKADGNIYTFNPSMALSIYETLRDFTIAETFDKVFGNGAYDAVVEFIKNAPDKTLPEFEGEITTELARWGIPKETIYTLILEMAGLEVEGFLEENKNVTVLEFVNSMMEEGQLTKEDFLAMVDEYAEGLRAMKLFDMFMANNKGEPMPSIDEEITNENDPIHKEITKIIEALGKASFRFTTNRDNELVSIAHNFDKFLYSFTQDSATFEISANGSMTITANDTYAQEFDKIVEEIDAVEKALSPNAPVTVDGKYTIISTNGKTFIWKIQQNKNDLSATFIFEKSALKNEVFNGVACTKYQASVYNLYIVDDSFLNAYYDCLGWYEIPIEAVAVRELINVHIWFDENEQVVGIELIDSEDELDFDKHSSIDVYYNLEKNTYSSKSAHSYKFVEAIEPNGCEYGKNIYLCSVCGHEMYERTGKGHDYATKAELKEGSITCEDGITVTRYCTKCDKVFYTEDARHHERTTYNKVLENASVCGDVIFTYEICPCGQEAYYEGTYQSDCIFDYVGNEDGYEIYRCAVNECAYTYYRMSRSDYTYHPEKEETCWYTSSESLMDKDGNVVLSFSRAYPNHQRYGRTSDDGRIYTTYCGLCNKTLSEETYDEYGRTIKYTDYIGDYSWTRVYTGCDYVHNDFNGNIYTGTNHVTRYENSGGSCSQYSYTRWICSICNKITDSSYSAPSSWVNDDTHNWSYNKETGIYTCMNCGTKSTTGADAYIVLEDMVDFDSFKVGYFDKKNLLSEGIIIEIIFNYGTDGSGILAENCDSYISIEDTTPIDYEGHSYYRSSGIITVDKDALLNDINAVSEDVTTISLVFSVFNGEDWIAHALTFDYNEIYNAK